MMIDGIVASAVSGLTLPSAGTGGIIVNQDEHRLVTATGAKIGFTPPVLNPFTFDGAYFDSPRLTQVSSTQMRYRHIKAGSLTFQYQHAWIVLPVNIKGAFQTNLVGLEISIEANPDSQTDYGYPREIEFGVTGNDFQTLQYSGTSNVADTNIPGPFGSHARAPDSRYNGFVRVSKAGGFTPIYSGMCVAPSEDQTGFGPDRYFDTNSVNFFAAIDLDQGWISGGLDPRFGSNIWWVTNNGPTFEWGPRTSGGPKPPPAYAEWATKSDFYVCILIRDDLNTTYDLDFNINLHGSEDLPFTLNFPTEFNVV